jgi:hypothetical protein
VQFVIRYVLAFSSLILGTLPIAAADEPLKVELNAVEGGAGKCRLSFVAENPSATPVDSLKLDLAIFGRDGVIQRRLLTEMAPVRPRKTVVRSFDVEGDCAAIGSILVNEVTACAPASLGDCLDRLSLSSRLPELRLFK